LAFFNFRPAKDEKPIVLSCRLSPPAYSSIDFAHFQRGIDNIRIDVQISDIFQTTVRRISRNTVELAVEQFKGKKSWEQLAQSSMGQIKRFQKIYTDTMESAIHQSKQTSDPALLWLARIASIGFIRKHIGAELDRAAILLKNEAKRAVGTNKAGQIQAQSVWLIRYRQRLYYFLINIFFKQMMTAESGTILKLNRAILGDGDIDAVKNIMFNPLLKSESPNQDEMLLMQYLLLPWPQQDDDAFVALNELLDSVFSQIPQSLIPDNAISIDIPCYLDVIHDFIPDQQQASLLDWRDNPENMEKLFSWLNKKELSAELAKAPDSPKNEQLEAENGSRKALYDLLTDRLKQAGVMSSIVASYNVKDAYRSLSGNLPIRLIFYYLLGGDKRKLAIQRIQGMGATDIGMAPKAVFAILDKCIPKGVEEKEWALRFMQDFIAYRRDLKLWALVQCWIDQVRTIDDENDMKLALTNRSLYIFLPANESDDTSDDIDGHVMIKADVRGSIGITSSLREQGLNPATHFSRTFFDPITELLPQFGAEKVFVEGDAVILSIMEHSNEQQRTAVSRACGLCRKIIQIVDQQNRHHAESGLPVLELGIGIVYASESPTFLFDGDHKITISPAIGRSDRLSSCSKVVRPILETADDHDPSHHVDMFAISEDGKMKNDKGESHLRYNVNGIELDAKAFAKLKNEIGLRASNVRLPGTKMTERYIIGQFPDVQGHIHILAIRQGIVRLWHPQREQRKALKQFYFEVIADDERYLSLAQMIK